MIRGDSAKQGAGERFPPGGRKQDGNNSVSGGNITRRRRLAARFLLAGAAAALAAGAALAAVISVTNFKALDFGTVGPDLASPGTAVVDTTGTKTVTGGVFDMGGQVRVGEFLVKGDKNTAYVCTHPASTQVTSGVSTATVDTFTTNVPLSGTFPNSGRVTVKIAGTLQVPAGLAAGAYTGMLTVTCGAFSGDVTIDVTAGTMISISNTASLEFGIAAPTGAAGTITVTPAGARTGANVTLLASAPAGASFTVTGEGNTAYVINLPASAILTGPGADMTIDTFTDDNPGPALPGAGSETFNVGATLNVAASQAAGSYTGTFGVTVNYN